MYFASNCHQNDSCLMSRCGKVLPMAVAVYQSSLPPHYTSKVHNNQLAQVSACVVLFRVTKIGGPTFYSRHCIHLTNTLADRPSRNIATNSSRNASHFGRTADSCARFDRSRIGTACIATTSWPRIPKYRTPMRTLRFFTIRRGPVPRPPVAAEPYRE